MIYFICPVKKVWYLWFEITTKNKMSRPMNCFMDFVRRTEKHLLMCNIFHA